MLSIQNKLFGSENKANNHTHHLSKIKKLSQLIDLQGNYRDTIVRELFNNHYSRSGDDYDSERLFPEVEMNILGYSLTLKGIIILA